MEAGTNPAGDIEALHAPWHGAAALLHIKLCHDHNVMGISCRQIFARFTVLSLAHPSVGHRKCRPSNLRTTFELPGMQPLTRYRRQSRGVRKGLPEWFEGKGGIRLRMCGTGCGMASRLEGFRLSSKTRLHKLA